jgi:uncharacterized protein (DUF362 family)
MAGSVVAVLKTQSTTVLQDYEKLAALAGMDHVLSRDVQTILKDNISWHFPFLSANTTPWQLEGTILALQNAGFDNLVSVHNNTVVTDPFRGEELNKLAPLYTKYGVTEKYNFKTDDIRWIEYRPKASMLALDRVFPEGIRIPEFFIGKNIVHLPTVKTHIYTTTTGAMKNAFGGLLNTRRHYTHTWIHETLVDLLAIQKEIHAGLFAVMDGTLCGNGPGPRTMIPVEKNLTLASADQVAIDAVAAKMMGFDPMSIKYLRLAHDRGLGCADPRDITIEGEDVSRFNFKFTVGDNLASKAGDVLWFGPMQSLQKLFFHTPLVYLFVFGSYFYHDYFWWPLKGKPLMKKVESQSQWGALFATYGEPKQ